MGIGASASGAILSAGGAYAKAENQRSALGYQASVASMNAKVAGWQASDTIRNGQTAEENQDLKTGAIMGAQRATMAANGVDLGGGNANDVLATSKFMGTRDALQIHDNALMQAWGYRVQQTNYQNEASQMKSMADSISPVLATGTSLLTGAGKVAQQWDTLAKANGTPNFADTVKDKWNKFWGNS